MSETNKYGFLMKFALLSISLLTSSVASVSGTIPQLSSSFPEQSTAMIEMVVMLPTLTGTLFVLFWIPVARKIGYKNTVLLGVLLTLIGGVGPAFIDNFYLILLFRAVLGAGIGLFNSLCFTLIDLFFTGKEQTWMLGFQSSFQGIGGALMVFIAGQLLVLGWHFSFLTYLLALPVLILFAIFVPNPPGNPAKEQKSTLYRPILKYALIQFFLMLVYNGLAVKLPSLYESKQIASATTASNVITVEQITGVLTGFIYFYIYRTLKRNTLPFACGCMGLGYIIISLSDSLAPSILGAVLTGIAFATIIPYMFNLASLISPPSAVVLSTTILIIGGKIAGFFTPLVLGLLGTIPVLSNQFAQSFLSSGFLLVLLAFALIFLQKKWLPGQ